MTQDNPEDGAAYILSVTDKGISACTEQGDPLVDYFEGRIFESLRGDTQAPDNLRASELMGLMECAYDMSGHGSGCVDLCADMEMDLRKNGPWQKRIGFMFDMARLAIPLLPALLRERFASAAMSEAQYLDTRAAEMKLLDRYALPYMRKTRSWINLMASLPVDDTLLQGAEAFARQQGFVNTAALLRERLDAKLLPTDIRYLDALSGGTEQAAIKPPRFLN